MLGVGSTASVVSPPFRFARRFCVCLARTWLVITVYRGTPRYKLVPSRTCNVFMHRCNQCSWMTQVEHGRGNGERGGVGGGKVVRVEDEDDL